MAVALRTPVRFPRSYAAKVITAGVAMKAVVMGVLVSILATSGFAESVALVLVSACATGVFGLLIVLVQVRAERELHRRMDTLENTGQRLEASTEAVAKATGAQTPPAVGGAS